MSASQVKTLLGLTNLSPRVIRAALTAGLPHRVSVISRELFDECHRVMHTRGKISRKQRIPYMYRGHVRCGACGCVITLEQQGRYRYVRCTRKRGGCPQPYAREEILHEQIRRSVEIVSLPDKTAHEILASLDRHAAKQAVAMQREEESLKQELARCQSRSSRVLLAYADSGITLEELRTFKNERFDERLRIERKLTDVAKGVQGRFEILRKTTRSCQRAFSIAQRGDPLENWQVFKSVGLNMTLRSSAAEVDPAC